MANTRTDYSVKIVSQSKDLTAKEKIAIKDTTNAVSLDEACEGAPLVIAPAFFVELEVHNEKSEDKDYTKYVVVDHSGQKYVTGSHSFWNAFIDIFDEMAGEDGVDYEIEIYKLPSKNYKGKSFLTCSIVM